MPHRRIPPPDSSDFAEAMKEWQEFVTQRMQDSQDHMERMDTRMNRLDSRMVRLEGEVKANTELTADMKKDTSEVLSILHTAKGGLKVLSTLGGVLRWAAGVAVAGGVLWAAMTGKFPH